MYTNCEPQPFSKLQHLPSNTPPFGGLPIHRSRLFQLTVDVAALDPERADGMKRERSALVRVRLSYGLRDCCTRMRILMRMVRGQRGIMLIHPGTTQMGRHHQLDRPSPAEGGSRVQQQLRESEREEVGKLAGVEGVRCQEGRRRQRERDRRTSRQSAVCAITKRGQFFRWARFCLAACISSRTHLLHSL